MEKGTTKSCLNCSDPRKYITANKRKPKWNVRSYFASETMHFLVRSTVSASCCHTTTLTQSIAVSARRLLSYPVEAASSLLYESLNSINAAAASPAVHCRDGEKHLIYSFQTSGYTATQHSRFIFCLSIPNSLLGRIN